MSKEPAIEQLKEIIKRHLDVKMLDIKKITEGYSHHMYDCRCELEDGGIKHYILRICYNTEEDVELGKELKVMEIYAQRGIPVPRIYASDVDSKESGFDYAIIEKLEGTSLKQLMDRLSANDKKAIARSVGELLRKIHSIELERFGKFTRSGAQEEEEFTFRKSDDAPTIDPWVRKMLKDTFHNLSGVVMLDIITPAQSHEIMDYIFSKKTLITGSIPVLIHGDFHADHILVKKIDDTWKITGIVDFEFASAHPPEYDFIKLHRSGLLHDVDFREGLLEGYNQGKIHQNFDELVEFYRVTRDIGLAYQLAKAGNKETMQKVLDTMFKIIRNQPYSPNPFQ